MPLALLAMVGVGESSAMWASLFRRAAIDTVEPGMKTSWVVLPYFSKKPASLATHRGAVLPVSLAVVKFISAADADTGTLSNINESIKVAVYFIRLFRRRRKPTLVLDQTAQIFDLPRMARVAVNDAGEPDT